MFKKISKSLAERRLSAWQMRQMRWVANADPFTQWEEINERMEKVLPTLPPLPPDFPDAKTSWKKFLTRYEQRKAEGYFSDPAAADALVYGNDPGTNRTM